jgi:hypothetical protein
VQLTFCVASCCTSVCVIDHNFGCKDVKDLHNSKHLYKYLDSLGHLERQRHDVSFWPTSSTDFGE